MKLPPYPSCKASGVEWIGEVPAHWDVKRLKMAVLLSDHKVEADEENPVPYIGMENIESWTGRLLPINADVVPTGTANTFAAGDTLFGKLRPYLAKACNPDFGGLCSTELLVLKGRSLGRRALLYSLLSDGFIELVDSSTYGSKMPRASWDFIGNCLVPIAPPDEQCAIANFLDRETARIDALIAKKRTLIERLQEKRTALISRTVTRGLPPAAARAAGLDPNPKLKHSGIDWLGDIPHHWSTRKIKWIGRVGNGSTPNRDNDAYWEDGTYPWLNSSFANQESVTSADEFVTEVALKECHLPRIPPPAVLVGITGQGRTRGMATTLLFEATINQHLAFIKADPQLMSTWFLRRALDSAYDYLRSESDGGGSTKGAITCEQLANLPLPLPPLPEQEAIADFLADATSDIDPMILKAVKAIDRLSEYRAALITAAVTGKVDVRSVAL
jgi:type I restriction enzyme S subunit